MKAIALTVIGLFIALAGLSVLPAFGQSRAYLTRIVAEVPFSPYAETAEKWLARKPVAGEGLTCLGCHGD
jgi:hypothetical protein